MRLPVGERDAAAHDFARRLLLAGEAEEDTAEALRLTLGMSRRAAVELVRRVARRPIA